MTSEERKQARIARDKAKRAEKKKIKNEKYNNMNTIFTLDHYFEAVNVCKKGVMWKATAQDYCRNAALMGINIIDTYKDGRIIPLQKTKKEIIRERGKERIITPIAFKDRVPQRMICDYSLVPLIEQTLIKNNCASMKNKGVSYARNEVEKYLKKATKLWGEDYYILITDFKNFFGSIPHATCRQVLEKLYDNPDMVDLVMEIIKSYQEFEIINGDLPDEQKEVELQRVRNEESAGICLGSQISQMMALLAPNRFDHYIKDEMGVKMYIRYMDDCIVIHNDKEFLCELYNGMKEIANSLGLEFSEKKTKIVKITKGFKFLKIHYRLVENNKIISTLDRTTVTRQRRKLKKFKVKYDNGEMTLDDIYNSMQSWLSHDTYAHNAYHADKNMKKLYNKLFDGYKLSNRYKREHNIKNGGKAKNGVL